MSAYYNEIDEFCCAWLSNLMDAGEIAPGRIDNRDIRDIRPDELRGYEQCHFFAGIGGWSLALRIAGVPNNWPCWTGSCPCQPFSQAGLRAGVADERHLWPSWFHLIDACKPARVLGEQVAAAIRHQWFDLVRRDMEGISYSLGMAVLPAASVGANHDRPRLWFIADSEWSKQSREKPRSREVGRVGRIKQPVPWDGNVSLALTRFRAMDDGIPRSVAATDAARNAIVPQVAAEFIQAYLERESL